MDVGSRRPWPAAPARFSATRAPPRSGGWGTKRTGVIEVSVAADAAPRRPGIIVHRRAVLSPADSLCSHGVRVTTPVCTLVDIALRLSDDRLEAAINEADKRGFVDPERLRAALDSMAGRHGVTAVRSTLDRRTFVPTGSELERRFIPIARAAGPGAASDAARGLRVQSRFLLARAWTGRRDRRSVLPPHAGAAGSRPPSRPGPHRSRPDAAALHHAQVRFDRDHVAATLAEVARRLRARAEPGL